MYPRYMSLYRERGCSYSGLIYPQYNMVPAEPTLGLAPYNMATYNQSGSSDARLVTNIGSGGANGRTMARLINTVF
jgi:hypothetical protein